VAVREALHQILEDPLHRQALIELLRDRGGMPPLRSTAGLSEPNVAGFGSACRA
jgi:hypothetical protein